MGNLRGKSLLVDENVGEDDAKRAMGILAAVFDEDSVMLVASCTFGGKPGALLGARLDDGGVIPMAILIGDDNIELLTEINGDKSPTLVKSKRGKDGNTKLSELMGAGKDLGEVAGGRIIIGDRIAGTELNDLDSLREKIKAKEEEVIGRVQDEQKTEGDLPKWSF